MSATLRKQHIPMPQSSMSKRNRDEYLALMCPTAEAPREPLATTPQYLGALMFCAREGTNLSHELQIEIQSPTGEARIAQ